MLQHNGLRSQSSVTTIPSSLLQIAANVVWSIVKLIPRTLPSHIAALIVEGWPPPNREPSRGEGDCVGGSRHQSQQGLLSLASTVTPVVGFLFVSRTGVIRPMRIVSGSRLLSRLWSSFQAP